MPSRLEPTTVLLYVGCCSASTVEPHLPALWMDESKSPDKERGAERPSGFMSLIATQTHTRQATHAPKQPWGVGSASQKAH